MASAPECALRADRAAPASRLDAAEVAVLRERAQVTAGRPAEHRDERRLRQCGELADRPHVPGLQAPRRRRADAPHALDRQRVQERELAVGGDDDQAVRLCDAAGHLREELRPRHADGDRQSHALAHRGAQAHRDLLRCARDPLHPAHVEEGFVDRQPFDDGRCVLEDGEQRPARFHVGGEARRDDDRLGAEATRLPSAHGRADAVRLRLVARGQHDAAADDDRPAAEPGVVPLLDRRKERIRVCVQDEHMFVIY